MKKIVLRLLTIVIVVGILSTGAYFGYNYYIESQNKEVEQTFYSYVFRSNFENIFDYNLEENIFDKLMNDNYSLKTKFDFSNTFPNESNFDVDKFTLETNTKTKKNNSQTTLKFNYSNNELFSIDILSNPSYIALKNSDVLTNYIGLKKDKVKTVLSKINPSLKDLYKNLEDLKSENNIRITDNNIFSSNNGEYIENFQKYISSKNYLDEGFIIIEQNGEKIETNAYSLTMNKDDFQRVYAILTQMIIDDENIKNSIISADETKNKLPETFESNLDFNEIVIEDQDEIYSLRGETNNTNTNANEKNYANDSISESVVIDKLDNLAEYTSKKIKDLDDYKLLYKAIKYLFATTTNFGVYVDEEDLQSDLDEIFNFLNQIIDEKINQNDDIKIITYVSNNQTVKTSVFLGDNIELNIDYINQTSNKYMTVITISEKNGDDYNGYTITFTKNKTTAIDNNSIEIGVVKDTKIVSKLELKLNVEGTTNSNKYTNNISVLYSGSDGKFSSNFSNTISFENSEVELINGDNTLLIDSLEDKDFYYFMNKLNSRIDSVYEEKVSKLNLINANTSDTILQRNEQESTTTDENTEEKEELIELLVDTISNEMGIAQEEEREYTIQNLKDLEIDGYNIQVSVSEDIAIIKINNYTFKIDKDFHLSE